MNETTLWNKCLEALGNRLSDKQMRTWLHPLEVTRESNTLKVVAPNKFIMEAIQNDYISMIEDVVMVSSENEVSKVKLSLPKPIETKVSASPQEQLRPVKQTLNKDLCFDNFIEGKSNQLAKAACKNVVNELGQYNPLYIYGGVGLGKTHLLHSIGNEILAENRNRRVVYLHSEKFVQNLSLIHI